MRQRSAILAFVFVVASIVVTPPAGTTALQGATPAACPATSEAENATIARRWHEDVINGSNLDALDEIVDPAIVHHAGTFPDGHGPEAVKGVLGALLTAFPDVHHTVKQVITDGDYVVTRWTAEGTQTGEFQGIAPTGRTVTWSGINVFRVQCGKIVEEWSEVDGLGRVAQLTARATPTP